jgi:indole-3-glycerol phosphate synthase
LRKDFIVSEYQLLEARACGADAVLLIVGAVTPVELASLAQTAASLGLDALVEVHDRDELAVALDSGAPIIGINNRNLRTLEVDIAVTEALVPRIPADRIVVSESGLKTAADLRRLSALGCHAFLMGERFMAEPDPGRALERVLASC